MTDVSVNRFGLTEVSSSSPATVDIVFVHGLNGDPHNTWTSEKSKTFWPSQLLPPLLEEEKARILVYGYDADVTSFTDGASRDKIHNHAEHLVAELAANRRIRKATERPIIFVAHSLGGLVVKRALIHSSDIRGQKIEHLRSIYVSTYGILFLGTPHKGSDVAQWGSRLEWICSAVMPRKVLDSQPQLVDALKKENETLQNIDRQFIQLMSKFHVFFFHEAKPTNLKGTLHFIVDEESASPTVQEVERAAIQADHSHMCKFENENAPGFDLVAEAIQRYADEAPESVRRSWSSEDQERLIGRKAAADALGFSDKGKSSSNLPNSSHTSPRPDVKNDTNETAPDLPRKPSEPYFIVPPGFRANTFFVGRDKEYQELDRRLFDKRRRIGTAAVLLHGQAGGGKSHLARQYVDKNRERFTGGVFWITSKLREERYQAYWAIYQKVIPREAPEMCTTERSYVEIVKAWFEGRQEWLIVFDGVTLDQDEDATDLQKFIPDSKNSSIIYISRAKNLESKQRLLRPVPIRVGPLKEDDARKLLFKSLDEFKKKRPSDADIKRGTELVKKIGGLPLAIDAISHRIADTHEPLAKFNIKSYSADPKMAGTYNKILDDLQRLGYMEAWNLIHLLCFFGQHIPVELINFGLKSLHHDGVEVKSSDSSNPDLNITFGILMRYALIERNEPDDSSCGSGSSSRDSLTGPEPIDVIKIHSVVQRFCCDSLNAKKILPEWLGYAVRLFGYSYHQADVRIKQKPAPGRVSDYREYLTHGRRLRDHTDTYESKTQPLHDIRASLDLVLAAIREEIECREPDSSSQESLTGRIQQVSVFDRISSSSSSAPSGSEIQIRTPNRPSPLPLPSADENEFGFPAHKPSIDSPRSLGTLTPISGGPRIVGQSPRTRFPAFRDDDGYDTDGEDLRPHSSSSMRREHSDATARPRGDTTMSKNSEWEVVPSSRKVRKTPRRRDLGTFRPQRAPAHAAVDRRHAAGSISRAPAPPENKKRPSLDAVQALSEFRNRTSPSSQSPSASFWRLASPSRIANAFSGQPSYASVTSRFTQTPPVIAQRESADQLSTLTPVVSDAAASDRGRQRNLGPSPLASDVVPPQQYGRQQQQQYITGDHYQPSSYPIGPSPAPMPMIENISTSSKRPYPTDAGRGDQAQIYSSTVLQTVSNSPSPSFRPPYSPPPLIPAGYSSQPMSRNISDRSHFSGAETEPPQHDPAFYPSPQLGIIMPYHAAESISPGRDRHSDGRPVRKSPKTMVHAIPAANADYQLQGTGAWTPNPIPPSSSARYTPPSPPGSHGQHVANMSRSSSSPGLAIETPSQGLGIVPFAPGANSPLGSPSSSYLMQFGDHAPISLEEARHRAIAHETKLREKDHEIRELRQMAEDVEHEKERMKQLRNMEREHSAGAPYPAVDLMPDHGSERRPRAGSEPRMGS